MTTDRLTAQPLFSGGGMGSSNDHLDLEELFRRALCPNLQLIAIGGPDDDRSSIKVYGAGRIWMFKDDWKERVDRLISAAEFIIMIPSFHSGTLWEVKQVRSRRMLNKVLFIMPEDYARNSRTFSAENMYFGKPLVRITRTGGHVMDHKRHWEKTISVMTGVGLTLPAYARTGALFTMGDDGAVRTIKPLILITRMRRVNRLRKLITALDFLPSVTGKQPLV